MALDPGHIKDFQEVWRKAYGDELDDGQAAEMATRLVDLYRLILTPRDDTPAEGGE